MVIYISAIFLSPTFCELYWYKYYHMAFLTSNVLIYTGLPMLRYADITPRCFRELQSISPPISLGVKGVNAMLGSFYTWQYATPSICRQGQICKIDYRPWVISHGPPRADLRRSCWHADMMRSHSPEVIKLISGDSNADWNYFKRGLSTTIIYRSILIDI